MSMSTGFKFYTAKAGLLSTKAECNAVMDRTREMLVNMLPVSGETVNAEELAERIGIDYFSVMRLLNPSKITNIRYCGFGNYCKI